jgi:hypothetical protein
MSVESEVVAQPRQDWGLWVVMCVIGLAFLLS